MGIQPEDNHVTTYEGPSNRRDRERLMSPQPSCFPLSGGTVNVYLSRIQREQSTVMEDGHINGNQWFSVFPISYKSQSI